MTVNINFPNNLTVGDLKDMLDDVPSDTLVEFSYIETCGCCVGREMPRKDNIHYFFEFNKEVEVSKEFTILKVPVLKIGEYFCYIIKD